MRRLVLVTVLLAGCAGSIPNVWPVLLECTATTGQLVDDIRAILEADGDSPQLSADSIRKIEALGASYGTQVVACIIEQLIDGWLSPDKATVSHDDAMAARRAQGFLNDHDSHPVMAE